MPRKPSAVAAVSLVAVIAIVSIVAGCQPTGRATGQAGVPGPAANDPVVTGPYQGGSASDDPASSAPAGSSQGTPPGTETAPVAGGAVVGSLADVTTLEPLSGVELLLARIEGTPDFPVAVLNRAEDPRAATDADGAFEFPGVEPGRYVIIVGPEGTGGMIEDRTAGTTLVVPVEDGQVVDVGRIAIERP